MKLSEVAEYLQVAEITVHQWAKHSYVPSFKLGTVWRLSRSDLEVWIKECQKQTERVGSQDTEPGDGDHTQV